ncbi:unnamed protein product [Owenia fusiformis]|uniref:Uncharacterized protein n=1 Tax=Owenia fusiformis TaxID=6347 RepID=A0A8J1XZ46_OWEFU|nr:unnamed protein product [Owenia fusiformis]
MAKKDNYLLKKIHSQEHFTPAATDFGIKHDDEARILYQSSMKEKHKKFQCKQSDFVKNHSLPILSGSPDGVISCECCGRGLLEIKCSYKYMYRNEFTEKQSGYKCYFDEDGSDHILVADMDNNRVNLLNHYGKFIPYLLTKEDGLYNPQSVAIKQEGQKVVGDRNGNIFTVTYRNQQHGGSLYKGLDKDGWEVFKYGKDGSGPDDLYNPFGLCTDGSNHIIVADNTNLRVHLLTPDAKFIRYLLTKEDCTICCNQAGGAAGSGRQEWQHIHYHIQEVRKYKLLKDLKKNNSHITSTSHGQLAFTNVTNIISVYGLDRTPKLNLMCRKPAAELQLKGITSTPAGGMLVCDQPTKTVYRVNPSTGDTTPLIKPDSDNNRVHVLTPDGKFERYLLTKEDDGSNHIIVADNTNLRVHLLTPDAKFIRYLLTKEDGTICCHQARGAAGSGRWEWEHIHCHIQEMGRLHGASPVEELLVCDPTTKTVYRVNPSTGDTTPLAKPGTCQSVASLCGINNI